MTADDILHAAATLVTGDRDEQHGPKAISLSRIATFWTVYLKHKVSAQDVAVMMVLLKVARTSTGSYNPDNYLDMAGYAGIAGELAAVVNVAHGPQQYPQGYKPYSDESLVP